MGFAASAGRTPRGQASGVILSKSRARKASKRQGGGTLRNAWQLQFTIRREFAYDLDMRKIVDHVSLQLMEHYRRSLRAGRRPGDGGRLPRTKPKTKAEFGGGAIYGLRSGYAADHWWRGNIRGGPFRCFVLVKPYGGEGGPTPAEAAPGGRAFVWKNALRRRPSVDVQSVRGRARGILQKSFDFAVAAGFGTVRTPAKARTRSGLLPELRS